VVEGGEGWAKYGKMMKNGQTYVKFMNSWNWISKLDLLAACWGKTLISQLVGLNEAQKRGET
jgi:hypothetical protein